MDASRSGPIFTLPCTIASFAGDGSSRAGYPHSRVSCWPREMVTGAGKVIVRPPPVVIATGAAGDGALSRGNRFANGTGRYGAGAGGGDAQA